MAPSGLLNHVTAATAAAAAAAAAAGSGGGGQWRRLRFRRRRPAGRHSRRGSTAVVGPGDRGSLTAVARWNFFVSLSQWRSDWRQEPTRRGLVPSPGTAGRPQVNTVCSLGARALGGGGMTRETATLPSPLTALPLALAPAHEVTTPAGQTDLTRARAPVLTTDSAAGWTAGGRAGGGAATDSDGGFCLVGPPSTAPLQRDREAKHAATTTGEGEGWGRRGAGGLPAVGGREAERAARL